MPQVMVGSDRDKADGHSANQSVSSICEEFGKYVMFVVQGQKSSSNCSDQHTNNNNYDV